MAKAMWNEGKEASPEPEGLLYLGLVLHAFCCLLRAELEKLRQRALNGLMAAPGFFFFTQ